MYTLRQDLDLSVSGKSEEGGNLWLLQDVINNKYYKLGSDEVKVLASLKGRTFDFQKLDQLIAGLLEKLGDNWSRARLEEFLLFLKQNNLLNGAGLETRTAMMRQREHLQPGILKTVLRHYLFLKFHILNPNKLLDRLLPVLSFVFSRWFWWLITANAVVGLYLTSRQWDFFLTSFLGYLNFEGLVIGAVAIAIAKILHEFGHAVVARRYGCKVHSMGFAILIFWPVLFTDTTDSWRLKNPKQRALIGSAGVLVELVLASICLTLWNFVDAGSLKSALFVLATTTWILTLAINLNPLMRFDGYFVLSDLLGVENLQSRSFALGRWWLREWLFAYGYEAPEKPRRELILFAYATWVYRFLLYFGIALIIYNYFFKLLGIVLVSVQLVTSLVMPLRKELLFWIENRNRAKLYPNTLLSFSLLAMFVLWLLVPMQRSLSLPAFIKSAESVAYFVQQEGRLDFIVQDDGTAVDNGDVLVEMNFPELEFRFDQTRRDSALIEAQLAGTGVSSAGSAPRAALVAQLQAAREQASELATRLEERKITASFDGVVRSINPELSAGQWLGVGERLLTVVQPNRQEVVAYLSEQNYQDIEVGQSAKFYLEGGEVAPQSVTLVRKEQFPVDSLDELYVASNYGGGVSVRDNNEGELSPQESTYRVTFGSDALKADRVLRGRIVIDAEASSPLGRFVNNAISIWRRESGF